MQINCIILVVVLAAAEAFATSKSKKVVENATDNSSTPSLPSISSSTSWTPPPKLANKGGRPRKANKKSNRDSQRQLRERKRKFGFRREDRIGEYGHTLKLPDRFKNMKRFEVSMARKKMRGLKRDEDIPAGLEGMPSVVLYRAEQDRLRNPSMSIRESILRQKKLFDQEHGIQDRPLSSAKFSSTSTSAASRDPDAIDPKDAELLLGLSKGAARYPRRNRSNVHRS
jgi:hypothetical protein